MHAQRVPDYFNIPSFSNEQSCYLCGFTSKPPIWFGLETQFVNIRFFLYLTLQSLLKIYSTIIVWGYLLSSFTITHS